VAHARAVGAHALAAYLLAYLGGCAGISAESLVTYCFHDTHNKGTRGFVVVAAVLLLTQCLLCNFMYYLVIRKRLTGVWRVKGRVWPAWLGDARLNSNCVIFC